MKIKLLVILMLMMAASLSISGCTINLPTSSPTTPTPLATATPTTWATPTPLATVKPTPTPIPDYSSSFNNNPDWLGLGYVLSSPFHKTTVNGRECYVGSLTKLGYTFQVKVFPFNSYSDAVYYREQLIDSYKANGYVISSSSTSDNWVGYLGNRYVQIQAFATSVAGVPVTLTIEYSI